MTGGLKGVFSDAVLEELRRHLDKDTFSYVFYVAVTLGKIVGEYQFTPLLPVVAARLPESLDEDYAHVAAALAAEVDYFVTRDEELKETLNEAKLVKAVAPDELLEELEKLGG